MPSVSPMCMCRVSSALRPLLIMLMISFAIISTTFATLGFYVFFACLFVLIIWHCFSKTIINHNENFRNSSTDHDHENTTEPQTTSFYIRRIPAPSPMEHRYWHDTRLFALGPTRGQLARLAIRALPPFQTFQALQQDQTTPSQIECPICMEDFKIGDLIQPFGVCVHHFHSSCINSWLLGGHTTCPVCRKELV